MSLPLILLGTLQLSYWVGKLTLPHLPEIHSRFKKKKKLRCPKARVRWPMHHCFLTESLPQWSLIDSYRQVGPTVELTNSWAGEVPVGISLSWLLIGRAEGCTVQLLGKTCCLVTGCGVIRQSNGYLLMAVLMLLCSIRIRWVQCALIFLTDFFPTADFDFTCLFKFCTSLFSLYSQTCQSAVLIYMALQQLPHDCMCRIYYS